MGYGSYLGSNCEMRANIGRFTSIAPYVRSHRGVHPLTSPYVTTCPMFYSTKKQNGKTFANRMLFNEFRKPPTIGNDVWVGENVFPMLNFSVFDSLFFKLKPKHYCLADPMYFKSSWRDKEVFRFFNILDEKVDWNMNIYVPANNLERFVKFSNLNNKFVSVIGVNTIGYSGFEKFRHYYYKKGYSCPPPQTVTNLGIFVGIQCGYKNIDLFGVDHTFLSDLVINEDNKLCQKYYHSYDKGEPEYKVIVRTDTNEVWKIGEYIVACGKMFLSHDLLEKYARSVNCRILNYTKCSMIDSYERVKTYEF